MRVTKELRLSLSVAVMVLLVSGFVGYAQQQDTAKSSVPALTEVAKKFAPKAGEQSKEVPALSEVERKFLSRGGLFPLEVAQLPEVGWPEVREFKDFKGGLDLSTYKTKVPPDRAIVLENALWNEQGEMYKRPGYDTLKTTPEVFNFLYRYYQQDGDKYLMGGSDTALYFWREDSTIWTHLASTGGTSGRWDGTTYEDVFVGTHLGISPVFWDGDSIISVTVLESADSFWVEWSNIVMDTAYTDCYRFQSVFTLTSPPATFEPNELVGFTFEWYKHAGSSEIQRMLVLSNTTDEIYTTLTCSLDLVPDKAERWCWLRPWFHSTSVDSGMSDSVTVCYDDPDYCCFRPGDYAPSVRFWDLDLDTTKLERDWTYIFAATDSRGNIWRNYIEDYGFMVGISDDTTFYIVMNGWMVDCFDEETEYEIYRASSFLEDEGIKYTVTFDKRLWFGWTGTGVDQDKNVLIYSNLRQFIFIPDNEIYLTPGDGDYITGMISLSDARHVDVPTHLLMVTKNASSYKIVPTATAGVYDSWYISTRIGCVSNSAMSVGEGLVLFPDQGGVWAWDQRSKPQCISLLIDPIFEAWDLGGLERISAIYNPQDRHYYLSYTSGEEIEHEGFLVSYALTPGGVTGIYTQELGSDGAQVDTQYKDLNEATGYHDLGSNSLGRYIHVWQNTLADSGNIWLQRFDSDRDMVGDSIRVNDNLWDPTNYELTADMNQSGDIVVVWQDNRQEDAGTNDIYGQILDFATGKVGTNFVLNECYETNTWDCGQPDVDINDNGFFVVVWEEMSDYGGTTPCDDACLMEILGQRYGVSEGIIGANFLVNDCRECTDDTIKDQSFPSVAVGQDNDFVVIWESTRGANTNDIWKQEFTSTGAKVDCDAMISPVVYTHAGRPELAINDSGLYVITWIETSVPSGEIDVFASTFNADHSVKTSGFKVNEDAGNAWDDTYPQVAINSQNNYVIVWEDERNPTDDIFAQVYNFYTGASGSNFCINDYPADEVAQFPEIKCFGSFVADYNCATLAWNIDYHGWSEQTFSFSAIEYQHGLTDPVKVLFVDPNDAHVYNYGTQADDVDDPVILTYQSPYLSFAQHPSWDVVMSYATLEAFLDTGEVYFYWYKDYSELVHVDTISCGTDCREEIQLPPEVAGHNISMKIITGAEIDDFTLSGYWWEYLINRWRK